MGVTTLPSPWGRREIKMVGQVEERERREEGGMK